MLVWTNNLKNANRIESNPKRISNASIVPMHHIYLYIYILNADVSDIAVTTCIYVLLLLLGNVAAFIVVAIVAVVSAIVNMTRHFVVDASQYIFCCFYCLLGHYANYNLFYYLCVKLHKPINMHSIITADQWTMNAKHNFNTIKIN